MLLTQEDEIKWALKVVKCGKCRPQCWQGQVFIRAFKDYRAGIKHWQDTVDEVSEAR